MKKFEKRNDTMAIVGFAPSTRGLTPWNNPKIDVAGLNEETHFPWFKQDEDKIACWFQFHARESFMRPDNHNDKDHAQWLGKKHPYPIFMQETHNDIPSSVRFPIEAVRKEFGTYWRSSLAYVIAWAYLVGYKRLELYGFEMASDSEYWGQRANTCYIIAKAMAKGMDIYVPPTSKLLTGIRYAYDNNLVGARQDLEVNLTRVNNDKNKIEAEMQGLMGEYKLFEELGKTYPEFIIEKDRISKELKKRDQLMFLMQGRAQGVSMAMKMFDTFSILEEESREVENYE